ncbi:AAA family ATPase [Psychrobacter sp. DM4]|uniref:AAA family ATPase n=1 Tax=Psychrobacter sp. DM4 TaxID=3440637 RepID=UPI003F508353
MANQLTQKWKIKDLKGVGDVELSLDDSKRVFVFFGSNGIGKTKTLEALLYFLLAQNKNFIPKGHTLKISDSIFQSICSNNLCINVKNALLSESKIYLPNIFNQVEVKNYDSVAYIGAKQRGSSEKNSNHRNKPMGSSESRRDTHSELFELAIVNGNLDRLGMNQDIHHWFIERAQSVNPYQKSDDNRQVDIDTVLGALNTLDNRIGKALNVDGDDNVYLTIEGQETELNNLSSGFISVVKIIQAIVSAYSAFTNEQDLLNVKGVVLIDEIESHLHVEWQTRIIPTLKELFPNTTFYIATHSPLVLSQLSEGEAYLLKRDNDNIVRSSVIDSPNKRILANVLRDAFGIDLNELKRESMEDGSQDVAKNRLLKLLRDPAGDTGE